METNRDKMRRLGMDTDADTVMDYAESEVCTYCDSFIERNLSPTNPSCEGRWCEDAVEGWLNEKATQTED